MNPASTATMKCATRPSALHREKPHPNRAELNAPERQSFIGERNETAMRRLTVVLEGITAGDYLTWVRDADPPTLGRELRSVDVQADLLGDRIDVLLHWSTDPPAPPAAARAAGFYLTPEVIELRTNHP